ncbi:piggyBac transposable element-derived protein 4 [Nephila pilipes]|uniref:PiggyBac transposable element-derived protein 4 n=1 Tax=Nephila pilipes TaxID=299642 RepID=A0A8X6QN64_NEPPI|nr:piggyBac transposable element-derived protein 4 [Nephila pilipes]
MASSSLKRYIDNLDSSTKDEDFEGIDTSDAGNARDWCEITASGRSGPPRFPFTGTPGVTFPVNINYTPLDMLEMFLDSNLMDIIVKETNNYAEEERKENRAKISRISNSRCRSVLHKYDKAASGLKNVGRPLTIDNPARLTERHFIAYIPPTPAKREPTRQCKVCCSKKFTRQLSLTEPHVLR